MNWLQELITNRFLLTGISSWFVAQLAKTIIHAIINKKLVLERMVGDGGMPSGHSATVTSLAVISALSFGFDSFQFAVTALLAVIVCHDAMGVRLETGKQAQIINEMVEAFEIWTKKELPEIKLKEFVGHTPIQVIAGILLGILNGCVMHFWVFPLF
jgi:acid phosphatase family membrane protein YuiD